MCISPIRIRHPTRSGEFLDVPCGKCLECANKKVNDWSFRMKQEMKDKNAYFFTLTYDDENLPYKHLDDEGNYVCITRGSGKKCLVLGKGWYCISPDNILHYELDCFRSPFVSFPCFYKEDLQKFVHSLRDDLRRSGYKGKIKYFISSEYGSKSLRPHYHGVIFGYPYELDKFIANIEKYWQKGFVSASICNEARIYYTLKYAFKNAVLKPRGLHPDSDRCFILCSKGIGSKFLTPEMVSFMKPENGNYRIYIHEKGITQCIPKYYRDKVFTSDFDKLKLKQLFWDEFNEFELCPESADPFKWRDECYNMKLQKVKDKLNKENM